jgi:major membrane immunogen (membrane-anchored lipoprotein)
MNKNNRSIGLIIAAVLVVFAVIIIWGIQIFSKKDTVDTNAETKESNLIDLSGYSNSGDIIIESASKDLSADGELNGYLITVLSKENGQSIRMEVAFDKSGTLIQSVKILDPGEADTIITDENFLNQFINLKVPVSLTDITYESTAEAEDTTDNATIDTATNTLDENSGTQTAAESSETSDTALIKDGTYLAETKAFDEQGYKDKVTMTIEGGKITEVYWDAYNEDGELKSVLSADGAYSMTKDGPTWQQQASAVADYVVQHQTAASITMNADGDTDSVSGVSISVSTFVDLIKECLDQASAKVSEASTQEVASETTETMDSVEITKSTEDSVTLTSEETDSTDATDTRTDSINAFIDGVNKAGSFLTDFVLKK